MTPLSFFPRQIGVPVLLIGFVFVLHTSAPSQQTVEEGVTSTGTRVAEWSLQHSLDRMSYQNICTAYGILNMAHATGNDALRKQIETKYRAELLDEKNPHRDNAEGTPAHQWFALVPLKLYNMTGREAYRKRGLELANEQYRNANTFGLPGYTDRGNVKDIFGATAVQSQAYAATGKRKYLERAIRQVMYYAALYQQPNGLFHHGPDTPQFWGRGVGWAAAAFAELLSVMPEDDPKRAQVLATYRLLADGLLRYQTENGMWRQLVNRDSWKETSSTGLFLFALAKGVKNEWLLGTSYPRATRVVQKGWNRLDDAYIDEKGRVQQVCVETRVAGNEDPEYYLNRPRKTGDPHGQAAVLWASASIVELVGH